MASSGRDPSTAGTSEPTGPSDELEVIEVARVVPASATFPAQHCTAFGERAGLKRMPHHAELDNGCGTAGTNGAVAHTAVAAVTEYEAMTPKALQRAGNHSTTDVGESGVLSGLALCHLQQLGEAMNSLAAEVHAIICRQQTLDQQFVETNKHLEHLEKLTVSCSEQVPQFQLDAVHENWERRLDEHERLLSKVWGASIEWTRRLDKQEQRLSEVCEMVSMRAATEWATRLEKHEQRLAEMSDRMLAIREGHRHMESLTEVVDLKWESLRQIEQQLPDIKQQSEQTLSKVQDQDDSLFQLRKNYDILLRRADRIERAIDFDGGPRPDSNRTVSNDVLSSRIDMHDRLIQELTRTLQPQW